MRRRDHDPTPPAPLCPPPPLLSLKRELPEVFQELYSSRFTGQVILHFHVGKPRMIEWRGKRFTLNT